jgi:hypothetical protein
MTAEEYIHKYKDYAIEQMIVYNIPASITLAQGMLESEYGNSILAMYANNHFGIKCHDDWNGDYFIMDDDTKHEHFRKYQNVDQSYQDHAAFLRSRPWYTFLFNYSRDDYRDWARGLSRAGYATAPDYSEHLIHIIEENKLFVYDTVLQKLHGFGILYDVKPENENKQSSLDFMIIKQGDCVYKIAREYNIAVTDLCKYNNITVNELLLPGKKLYLKARPNDGQSGRGDKHPANNKADIALPEDKTSPKG